MVTETGWTKEFPKVEGVYWARRTQTGRPEPQAIRVWEYDGDWYAYRFGDGRDIEAEDFTKSLYEYLGPVTVSDAEQLVELRRAAQSLLDVIDNADYGLDVYSLAPNLRTAAKKLAAVLIGNDFEVKTNAD